MMRIEKRETYAETCEQIIEWSGQYPAVFELLPRADDLQMFDVVTSSRDGEYPVEILIGDCYTSVNRRTGVVGFDLDADGILYLAAKSAEGRPRSQIFCDVRREMHSGQGALVFYEKDALACVGEFPSWSRLRDASGMELFREGVDPEFWYVNMVRCKIECAMTYYYSWFKPSGHSLEAAMTLVEMIEWMGKDPAFDRRSLQTEQKRWALGDANDLMDKAEATEAEGRNVHAELLVRLAEDDRFWMKWRAFGCRNGWWE